MSKKCLHSFMVLALLFSVIAVPVNYALADYYVQPDTPIAGDILYTGETFDIKWTTHSTTQSVVISYSTDNGVNYTPVPGGTVAATKDVQQSLPWTVPNVNSSQCILKFHYTYNWLGSPKEKDVFSPVFAIHISPTPTNLVATALSDTEIKLTWEDNAEIENKYRIDRRVYGTTEWSVIQWELPPNTTEFTDSGLAEKTMYEYRVYCIQPPNNYYGDFSNVAYATTLASASVEFAELGAPTLIATATSDGKIKLQWTDENVDIEDGYHIYKQIGSTGVMTFLTDVGSAVGEYPDSNVEPGTTYYYKISAYNSLSESEYSNTASATAIEPSSQLVATVMRFQVGSTTFYVNDAAKSLDAAPISTEGRILLPIRFVVENLGGTADWSNNQATINCNGHILILRLNENSASVDGQFKLIDPGNSTVMPMESGGRIMMPLRFVGENIGCSAEWTGTEAVIVYPADLD